MLRKNKVALTLAIYMPLAVIIPICLFFFFTHTMSTITRISYFFIIPCLLMLIFPIRKWAIAENEFKQSSSLLKWILSIIVIEIIALLLFLNQNILLFQQGLLVSPISPQHIANKLPSHSLMNWGLFPWSMICSIAVAFAYLSFRKNIFSPFSSLTKRLSSAYLTTILKTTIDTYINLSTKIFLSMNVLFVAMQFSYLFTKTATTPIDAIIILNILILLYKGKNVQQKLNTVDQWKLPLGIHYIILFILYVLLLLITHFFLRLLPQAPLDQANKQMVSIVTSLQQSPAIWDLWNWSWWIFSIPLFSSLLIKYSANKKIFSFVLTALALPFFIILLKMGFHFSVDKILHQICTNHLANLLVLLGCSLFLGFILLNKQSTALLWLGFYPLKPLKKCHDEKLKKIRNQLWLFTILLGGIIMLGGIIVAYLLLACLALPCLFIFIRLMINRKMWMCS